MEKSVVGKNVERRPARSWTAALAWAICVLAIAGAVAFVVLEVTRGSTSVAEQLLSGGQQAFGAIAFAIVGALIVSRGRGNMIGWLFLLAAVSYTLSGVGAALSDTYEAASGAWRAGVFLNAWSWAPGFFVVVTLLLLLFPDGHLPTRRYRWVGWLAGGSIALSVVGGLLSKTAGNTPGYVSPLPTIPDAGTAIAFIAGGIGVLVAAVASVVSLVGRYRRSTGVERDQMRWFVYAGIATIVLTPTRVVGVHQPILLAIGLLSTLILPVAVGIAILKHRLYDIDVVISKTVLYASLVAFITAVYVGIVVGIGSLLGTSDRTNVPLSIAATAIVAVAFQPVRERVQRFANRLVYGKRATPYEVLSEFSERLGGAYSAEDLLPRMARILAEGTGAQRADVWLIVGGRLRPEASWPQGADQPATMEVDPFPSALIPVRHQGELLGALSLEKRIGDTMSATEEKLVEDLAGQAGLVLRNVRLTEELMERLDELRASRQRLVAAQDEERRKLERNLHDGAQQQLVALSVKARLAQQLAQRDPAKVQDMLAQIQADTGEALENLRDLARGIYPPLLADQGLVAALGAQARKAAVPTTVQGEGLGRFGQDVEAAVYFSCLEALQNVAKYAEATNATIVLSNGAGELRFEVRDDGRGFDATSTSYGTGLQGIADRLAALGGSVEVRSRFGEGTEVSGSLPLEASR